jgi:hypothetical protein
VAANPDALVNIPGGGTLSAIDPATYDCLVGKTSSAGTNGCDPRLTVELAPPKGAQITLIEFGNSRNLTMSSGATVDALYDIQQWAKGVGITTDLSKNITFTNVGNPIDNTVNNSTTNAGTVQYAECLYRYGGSTHS